MRNHRATMRLSCLLGLPLLTLPLTGCGGGGGNGGSGSPSPAAPLSVSAATPDGLTATLAEDRSTVPVGGGVTYTLTLTNNTSQPIVIQTFLNGPGGSPAVSGGLTVANSANLQVYPSTQAEPSGVVSPAPQPQAYTITPGQTISTSTVVPSTYLSAKGQYGATALFLTGPGGNVVTKLGPLTVTVQ